MRWLVVALARSFGLVIVTGTISWAQSGQDPCVPYQFISSPITLSQDPPIIGASNHVTALVANCGTVAAVNVRVQLYYTTWSLSFGVVTPGGGLWAPIGPPVEILSIQPYNGTPGDMTNFKNVEQDFVFPPAEHVCIGVWVLPLPDNPNDDDRSNDWWHRNEKTKLAGPDFSFDVPLRNGTAGPIAAFVYQAPAGLAATVAGKPCYIVDTHVTCDGINGRSVDVPAGGEVPFPVDHNFPADTLPGTKVDIPLGAFVGGPPIQNTPAGFSQVLLHVVFSRPQQVKGECLTSLSTLESEVAASSLKPGEKTSLQRRLDEIAGHISTSLHPGFWIDDFHLRVSAGAGVYAQEMTAALQQIHLIQKEEMPVAWQMVLNVCMRNLVDADRIIAQQAIHDSGGGPSSPAAQLLAEGDRVELGGDFVKAIRIYIEAWLRAVH